MLDNEEFGYNRDHMILFLNSLPGPKFPDQLLLQALVVGQDMDADDTPPVISASANHMGALEHPQELRNLINDEVDKGWITAASIHPSHVPFHAGPVSVVPKPGSNKLRKVGDGTHPRENSLDSSLGKYLLSPNDNCRRGPEYVQQWGHAAQIGRIMHVYLDTLKYTEYEVVGSCRDFESWYRQTPVAKRDRWSNEIIIDGMLLSDFMMVIGKLPAGHVGQRASGIGAMYANAIFDYHWPTIVKQLPNNLLMAIAEMQEGRSQVYGPLAEQLRPMSIVSYQDDHILIFMSKILAELYDNLLFPAVEKH